MTKRIAIFASGSGSNAEKIIQYFEGHDSIQVNHVYTNNEQAGVIGRSVKYNIPVTVFKKSKNILEQLLALNTDLIVLAGYLRLIPKSLILEFPNKIINIHPSLLPAYGGMGMYGESVHQAVYQNNEKFSGITIHYVNEKYDEGAIIFQAQTDITASKNSEEIAQKVLELEHQHYAPQIERLLQ